MNDRLSPFANMLELQVTNSLVMQLTEPAAQWIAWITHTVTVSANCSWVLNHHNDTFLNTLQQCLGIAVSGRSNDNMPRSVWVQFHDDNVSWIVADFSMCLNAPQSFAPPQPTGEAYDVPHTQLVREGDISSPFLSLSKSLVSHPSLEASPLEQWVGKPSP